MLSGYVHSVTDFIAQHPHWAGILVFLAASGEAIAVVGSFVPGSTILVAAGTMVGLGHLSLWQIFVWAVAGAIIGDGVSYWIGHRYGHLIETIWPFSRRPEILTYGETFFRKHGGKSVLIGRFFPPTRAIVPVIAGILDMRPVTFYTMNALSALGWAAGHILPGVVLGGALSVVGHVSGRLLALILAVGIVMVLAAWGLRFAVGAMMPVLSGCRNAATTWARRRPGRVADALARILDPDRDGIAGEILLGLFASACLIAFLALLEDVATRDAIVQADDAISQFIQQFRTGWSDHVMVLVTSFGDTTVTGAVAAAGLAWLAWRRHWRVAGGFAVALVLAAGATFALKELVHAPRPIALSSGADAFSFPSGHATMAATLYGVVAWLIASGLPPWWRRVPIIVCGALVGLIAASRVYLAAHWPSDVVAGLCLGFALAAVFAVVFIRTDPVRIRPLGLAAALAVVFLGVGIWHGATTFDSALARYAPQHKVSRLTEQQWLGGAWRTLAPRRIDLKGEAEEPFVLQWGGGVESLKSCLAEIGWQAPVPWSAASIANFLNPNAAIVDLPALPLLHDGHPAAMTLAMPAADDRLVLRAWRTTTLLGNDSSTHPILLVSILRNRPLRPMGLATVFRVQRISDKTLKTYLARPISDTAAPACSSLKLWPGSVISSTGAR